MFEALFTVTNPVPIKEALYQKKMIDSPICRTLGEMPASGKKDIADILKIFDKPKRCSKTPISNEEFLNVQTHKLYLLQQKIQRSKQK